MNNAYLPPHSMEHEQVLLGGILHDPSKIDEVREIVSAEDFYSLAHAEVFRSLSILNDANAPIEPFAISEELKRRRIEATDINLAELAAAGLPSLVLSAAETIRGLAEIRAIEMLTRVINAECHDARPRDAVEFEEFKNSVEQRIFDVCERRACQSMRRASEMIPATRERFAAYARHETPPGTVRTGFDEVDRATCGLTPSTLTIVAARPSMGKSGFLLQLAMNAAESGVGVAFFSLEMAHASIMDRAACCRAELSLATARAGKLDRDEIAKLSKTLGEIDKLQIFFDDDPEPNFQTIRARSRRLARRSGLGLIIVDYLQYVRARDLRDPRERQISELSRSFKKLSKELNVPVVVASQLNRQAEMRANHRPQLSDLRESGAIEQDADLVALLHRPEYYDPNDRPGEADLIIAKQRNGPRLTIAMKFNPEAVRFSEL